MRFGPLGTALLSGIERFTILAKLGEGGMGTVYAAYDSVLDRRVALKVVRADRRRNNDYVTPRDQLLREAQAMARLSHPNVVAIHEVGQIAEDVFVVLELVDGATLEAWLVERRRDWRTVIGAFIEAGRGLAAAHEAGLVHRDFKPQNVLVRRDGRIQVTDFGVVSMG
ncbi:MAG TPA: serine/threonine-protein kinase, partial [Kofleriaceae bacterium]|nr:serine/threonine-protein kinase [Kofleriaceae bacterium]